MLTLPKEFLSEGGGGGVIQGTASEATLICLVAARYRKLQSILNSNSNSNSNSNDSSNDGNHSNGKVAETEQDLMSKLVVYTSDQAHSCVEKVGYLIL